MALSNPPLSKASRLVQRLSGSDQNVRTLLTGSAGVLAISILGQITAFLVQAWVARTVGVEAFGVYSLAFTWFNVLLVAGLLGFDTGALRFLPTFSASSSNAAHFRRYSRKVVSAASITTSAICAIVVTALPISRELQFTFYGASLLIPVWAIYRLSHSELQALNAAPAAQSLISLARPLLWLTVLAVFNRLTAETAGPVAVILSHVVAMALVAGVAMWGARTVRLRSEAVGASDDTEPEPREWLRVSVPLSLVSGMRLLLNRLDIILIGILIDPIEAGIYAVASRTAQLTAFGLSATNQVVAPMISRLHSQNKMRELAKVVQLSSAVSAGSVIVLSVGAIALSSQLLGLFGERFIEGRNVFFILCAMQIINAATGPVGHLLNMTGFQDLNSKILAAVLVLNVLFNLPAIQRYGIVGAAVVTAVLGSAKNIWTWWEVRRRLGISSLAFGVGQPEEPSR